MENFLVAEKNAELIETLQKFITQSNLAEFENRLHLLLVFHCHASHLTKTKARGEFLFKSCHLNNIYLQQKIL